MIRINGLIVAIAISFTATITHAGLPQKVVGGIPAYPGELPYQVSLRYYGRHVCGGAIISEQHILTSAACVKPLIRMANATVATGSVNVNEGQTHAIKIIIYHSEWNVHVPGAPDDIALVMLANKMTFNAVQNKIALPTALPPGRVIAIISGWGYRANKYSYVPNLSKAEVKTLDSVECHEYVKGNSTIWPQQLCTFSISGVGMCMGDQGGPVVYNNELIGLVSWGYLCALGHPDVHTNVYSHLQWINYHLQIS